jgi:hypothetical protein
LGQRSVTRQLALFHLHRNGFRTEQQFEEKPMLTLLIPSGDGAILAKSHCGPRTSGGK